MATQADVTALINRLKAVETNIATIEANEAAAVASQIDLTELTNTVTEVEAQVTKGLPVAATPAITPSA